MDCFFGNFYPCLKVFSEERSSYLNVETEPRIQCYGGGHPCIHVLTNSSVGSSAHLKVKTEPRIYWCNRGNPCINV